MHLCKSCLSSRAHHQYYKRNKPHPKASFFHPTPRNQNWFTNYSIVCHPTFSSLQLFCNLFNTSFHFFRKGSSWRNAPQGSKGAHNKPSQSLLSLVKNDLFDLHHPWKHANQTGPRLPKVLKSPFPSCLLYQQYFLITSQSWLVKMKSLPFPKMWLRNKDEIDLELVESMSSTMTNTFCQWSSLSNNWHSTSSNGHDLISPKKWYASYLLETIHETSCANVVLPIHPIPTIPTKWTFCNFCLTLATCAVSRNVRFGGSILLNSFAYQKENVVNDFYQSHGCIWWNIKKWHYVINFLFF